MSTPHVVGAINFGPALGHGETITNKNPEYRLYVKKSGIMVLQQCQNLSGNLIWVDIPTVFEESPRGPHTQHEHSRPIS